MVIDNQPGRANVGRLDTRLHAKSMGVFVAGKPADSGGGMLHRYDGSHHDPGAHFVADRVEAGHRPDSFRPGHGSEPDDRIATSAAGHGAVRVGTDLQVISGADYRGDHAMVDPLVPVADRHHLHTGNFIVVAALDASREVA